MKICYFADGESIHVIRWCKHFAMLGYEVHLISFKKVQIEDITCHFINSGKISVGGGNWKVLLKYAHLKKLLKLIQPDILHAHYATSYGITGALAGFHPYIITALGSDVLISPKQSFVYRMLLKYAFSKADWITAMADHMKYEIEEMGVSSAKVTTVPFGIDASIFNRINSTRNEKDFVITSTRNFETVYNIPHLINALAILKTSIPNLKLNLIGDGSLRADLEKFIEEKGLKEVTTFYGKIPQVEIANILRQSNVFVSVSVSDGNNISLNEAMACGAFCIATDIPANRQWIEDGLNGFLVEINDVQGLADKILTSYQKYEDLQKLALTMNDKIIVEKAIWKNNMQKVEEMYKSLIKK